MHCLLAFILFVWLLRALYCYWIYMFLKQCEMRSNVVFCNRHRSLFHVAFYLSSLQLQLASLVVTKVRNRFVLRNRSNAHWHRSSSSILHLLYLLYFISFGVKKFSLLKGCIIVRLYFRFDIFTRFWTVCLVNATFEWFTVLFGWHVLTNALELADHA